MASVQERLQLKRLPLDNWTISEKLYLASAVVNNGDQNWMGVSRSLKMFCGTNRPDDWFSQKSCAAQYGKLLENVETPKRKKRNEKDTSQSMVETPSELILRKLTQERIAELEKLMQEKREEYVKTKGEMTAIENGLVDEQKLREWWSDIEAEENRREKEQQKHAQWLKEREERKREMERSWRSNALHYQQGSPVQGSPSKSQLKVKLEEMEVDDPNSRQGTSPLLTSLLKSPSPAPNPTVTSILHNVINVSGIQTRVAAPTITNLLTGSTTILTQQTLAKPIVASVVSSIATPFAAQLQTQPLTGPAPSDQSINNISQSPSQSAPTLSMLLENKNKESPAKVPSLVHIDQSSTKANETKPTTSNEQEDVAADSPIKDEDQQLMEDFNGLIPDNIDELANILNENNAIILNPELLEEESILDSVDASISVTDNATEEVEMNVAENESKDVEMAEVADEKFQDPIESLVKSEVVTEDVEQPKEEPQTVDEENTDVKTEDSTEIKQDENSSHSTLGDMEKVASLSRVDDDDSSSDLSNDTPLSELIKQESTAKAELQQKTAAAAAAAEAEAAEVETDAKIEKEEEPDTESDSNDDKCLGSIKREMSAQKENESSSENSSETPADNAKIIEVDEKEEEKVEDVVVVEPAVEVDEEEIQTIDDEDKKEDVEIVDETIETPPDLKPEDDEIVDLSSNEASEVQEKEIDDDVHRATPVTTVDVDVDEIEEVQTIADDEEKNASNQSPSKAERSGVDVPENFANIFSNDDSVDEVVEEAVEVTEPTERTETIETEEKKEVDDVEHRETPTMVTEVEETIEDKGSVESVEIVEIKDDDDRSDSQIIVIEEADDLIIEDIVPTTDTEKNDEITTNEQSEPKEEEEEEEVESNVDEPTPKTEPERKSSTDDELFEDAKEQIDDVKSEDLQQIAETDASQQPITIIDTDDDMPMEVIKEDKVGRAKRDYSRRNKESTQSIDKRSEETTSSDDVFSTIGSRLRLKERDRDRSESPYVEEDSSEPPAKSKRRYSSTPNIDSLPNSPASSDDREYRSWKKSILLVYNGLITHRYASMFSKPITEDQAPNYKKIVRQPMDLQTLKRNIDSGSIRTTIDFQRYVMLMCHNAMFYNHDDKLLCERAKEMLTDALTVIEDFTDTWKKENEKSTTVASTSTGSTTKIVRGRKSNRLMN